MDEKKYVAPEGMLKAVDDALNADNIHLDWSGPSDCVRLPGVACEAAIRWLAENPIVPTFDVTQAYFDSLPADLPAKAAMARWAIEWQRRCFLAPEPGIPEAVKDLLCDPVNAGRGLRFGDMADKVNDAILEAYRRGRAERKP